jgi:hypothetical protein
MVNKEKLIVEEVEQFPETSISDLVDGTAVPLFGHTIERYSYDGVI